MNQDTKQIIVSWHLKFHENIYPFHIINNNLLKNNKNDKNLDFLNVVDVIPNLSNIVNNTRRDETVGNQVSMNDSISAEHSNSDYSLNEEIGNSPSDDIRQGTWFYY